MPTRSTDPYEHAAEAIYNSAVAFSAYISWDNLAIENKRPWRKMATYAVAAWRKNGGDRNIHQELRAQATRENLGIEEYLEMDDKRVGSSVGTDPDGGTDSGDDPLTIPPIGKSRD